MGEGEVENHRCAAELRVFSSCLVYRGTSGRRVGLLTVMVHVAALRFLLSETA